MDLASNLPAGWTSTSAQQAYAEKGIYGLAAWGLAGDVGWRSRFSESRLPTRYWEEPTGQRRIYAGSSAPAKNWGEISAKDYDKRLRGGTYRFVPAVPAPELAPTTPQGAPPEGQAQERYDEFLPEVSGAEKFGLQTPGIQQQIKRMVITSEMVGFPKTRELPRDSMVSEKAITEAKAKSAEYEKTISPLIWKAGEMPEERIGPYVEHQLTPTIESIFNSDMVKNIFTYPFAAGSAEVVKETIKGAVSTAHYGIPFVGQALAAYSAGELIGTEIKQPGTIQATVGQMLANPPRLIGSLAGPFIISAGIGKATSYIKAGGLIGKSKATIKAELNTILESRRPFINFNKEPVGTSSVTSSNVFVEPSGKAATGYSTSMAYIKPGKLLNIESINKYIIEQLPGKKASFKITGDHAGTITKVAENANKPIMFDAKSYSLQTGELDVMKITPTPTKTFVNLNLPKADIKTFSKSGSLKTSETFFGKVNLIGGKYKTTSVAIVKSGTKGINLKQTPAINILSTSEAFERSSIFRLAEPIEKPRFLKPINLVSIESLQTISSAKEIAGAAVKAATKETLKTPIAPQIFRLTNKLKELSSPATKSALSSRIFGPMLKSVVSTTALAGLAAATNQIQKPTLIKTTKTQLKSSQATTSFFSSDYLQTTTASKVKMDLIQNLKPLSGQKQPQKLSTEQATSLKTELLSPIPPAISTSQGPGPSPAVPPFNPSPAWEITPSLFYLTPIRTPKKKHVEKKADKFNMKNEYTPSLGGIFLRRKAKKKPKPMSYFTGLTIRPMIKTR